MAAREIIMIRTLIEAMRHAHRAVICANRAEEPNQRNMHICHLSIHLITMGVISVAVTMIAFVWPPEKIFAYPTYMHVILSLVLGFIVVFGFVGITVGICLLAMNDPGQYHNLVMAILWTSDVASAFVIGILLVTYFSRS